MNTTAARPGHARNRTGQAFTLVRGVVERLPPEPPSFVLAQILNQLLLPRLDAAARAALAQRTVEIHVQDLGVRCRLALDANDIDGFSPALRETPVAVRISAPIEAFWRLASGKEDPDTLFFERVLVLEGDTEFGLLLKNSLEAVGPLHLTALRPPTPAQALQSARALIGVVRALLPQIGSLSKGRDAARH